MNVCRLISAVALVFTTGTATAQSVNMLHLFDGNTQGRAPASHGVLNADGSIYYGTCFDGFPTASRGSVWRINVDGTGFQVLRAFDATNAATQGGNPRGELILRQLPGGPAKLVGINSEGLANGAGTLWQMNLDGSNFEVLYAFDGSRDGTELADVREYAGGFVGVAASDFLNNAGTVWRINADGTGFQRLKLFTGVFEGSRPLFAPTPVGSTLYGTTANGSLFPSGDSDGTIYRINDDGSDFQEIHKFPVGMGNPFGRLVEIGTYLSGVTARGGANGVGAIYRFTPDGDADDLQVVFDFDGVLNLRDPTGGITLAPDGDTLWGTTSGGGIDDRGVLWSYNVVTNEGEFVANLGPVGWLGNALGPGPRFSPDGLTLYGVTATGGLVPGNSGTIWSHSIASPCSAADIAPAFGVLDVDDVVRAVRLLDDVPVNLDFNDDGVEDFFDLADYLRAFDMGCH